ncbi:GGDEF domain-containing protein [Lutibacter sp. B2]|nr:GGDEF domain-containing protein [Lutibacter sp. B2]
MNKDFIIMNALDGVRTIMNISLEKGIGYFPVAEEERIIGVITYKELMQAHPNRIAADAITQNFLSINTDTSIWEAKELFEGKNTESLLVEKNNEVVGLVTESDLSIELGKHIDLLTGLYKSDYIYYHIAKLIENKSGISVIFIDVNNFGYIDKEYGHICGDKILKEIAILLNKHKDPDTYLCRFGGDEYIVVTPYHMEKAKSMAKKLIDIVGTYKFHDEFNVSISAGIAEERIYQKRITDIYTVVSNLINRASLASSRAKKNKCEFITACEMNIDEIA